MSLSALLRLQELMQALGPSTAAIEWLIQESESSWSLGMNNGAELGVSFCSSPDRLLLSAIIGKPEEPDRQTIYTTMLCSNLLYAEEKALRIALTGPDGDLMLLSEMTPADWTLSEMIEALSRFSEMTHHFIEGLRLSMEDIVEPTSNFNASARV